MTLEVQFLTLLMMFGSGILLGIMFDTYRVLSGQLQMNRWVVSLLDVVYWMIATLLVFKVLLHSNQGQIRLYVFIGLFVGIWIYFRVFSPWTIRAVRFMMNVIKQLILICKKIIDLLVISPILWLYKCFTIFFGFLVAITIFLGKIVLQLFYPVRWVYSRFVLPFFQKTVDISRRKSWLSSIWIRLKRWLKL